jgi:hypothetical protein
VPVIGYVGTGSAAHFYDVPPFHLDEVTGPPAASESTATLEIRGDSLGPFFNRWYLSYDDLRRPTTDLIGQLCVVGLADRRSLVKQVQRGCDLGLYNLHSATENPIVDVKIEWAATVDSISRHIPR